MSGPIGWRLGATLTALNGLFFGIGLAITIATRPRTQA